MVEESPPLLPPAKDSIEPEPATALEPDSGEPTPDPANEPDFICACPSYMRSPCEWLRLPFYKAIGNRRYCVLHYPGKGKDAEFKAMLDIMVKENHFDFRGVWFPDEVDFSLIFSTRADFHSATFSADASFISATFNADADFSYATFGAKAEFRFATFNAQANFFSATFNGSIHFLGRAGERPLEDGTTLPQKALGKDPSLNFQHVSIEHPERIAFHTLTLRPHWFVNVDSRQFVFTDIDWQWNHISIKQEIAALDRITMKDVGKEPKEVPPPPKKRERRLHLNRLLTIACRQLADNAEANNRYAEASRFRYWAMDLARRTKWEGWSFWKTDWLHMLYWVVSGYGERIRLALFWLLALWIVFASLYAHVGFAKSEVKSETPIASTVIDAESDIVGQPLPLKRAFTYSLAVMSLQKPEPKPLTGTAQTLVLLETILGPVQAALLLLAIRRKFMR